MADRPHEAAQRFWRGSGRGGAQASTIGAKSGSTVEGTVSANRAGYGFLRVEGLKDSVFIPPPEMRGVMHGDRLRVKLSRDASDRWSGAVEQVRRARRERLPRNRRDSGAQRLGDRRGSPPAAALCGGPHRSARARSGDWVIARITPSRQLDSRQRKHAMRSVSIRIVRWSSPPRRRSRASICPHEFSVSGAARGAVLGRAGRSAGGGLAHRPARAAARHDRRRGRARLRRRGLCGASPERLSPDRRDRGCQSLRPAGHGARYRSARARHLGVLSDARDADAADRALGSISARSRRTSIGCASSRTW